MPKLMQNPSKMTATEHLSQGGRLVGTEGRELPLRAVELSAAAAGGIARTELRQIFANPYEEPLKLTYKFPLPADGAVAAYEVLVGQRVIRGQIERRAEARKRYERALVEGRTAGLLDQERANLFTQNLGNVPPGSDVTVGLTIDQPLAWLPEGLWEWRFPTVAAPRYLGHEGRVPDGGEVTVDVSDRNTGVRATLELVIGDEITGGEPVSPSHPVLAEGSRVRLGGEGVALDRDIVVRWQVARPQTGVALRRARPAEGAPHAASAYGLLTLVPPPAPEATLSRDLIVLLDVSGSMTGEPLHRAKKLVVELIDSLGEIDRLEIVAFAGQPQRWQPGPVHTTVAMRQEAVRWVESLSAGGGTEMVSAVHEALRPLRADAQRQVVLVTDGLIGFETEAIRAVRDGLPAASRVHAVGVGSATNRAFLHAAARAGRGVEVIVDLDERTEQGGARLVAATQGPALVDVEVAGTAVEACAPQSPRDLMAASPVLTGLRLRPEGGELTVRGRTSTGAWEQQIEVPPTSFGEGDPAVTALYGREAVEDLELDLAAGAPRPEIDPAIEKIGLEFQLSTRRTSWIAISEEPTVDRRQPVRIERIPQELPYGMSAEGLGLAEVGGIVRLGQAFHLSETEVMFRRSDERPSLRKVSFRQPELLAREVAERLFQKWTKYLDLLASRSRGPGEHLKKALHRARQALHRLREAERTAHAVRRARGEIRALAEGPEMLERLGAEVRVVFRGLADELKILEQLLPEARQHTEPGTLSFSGRVLPTSGKGSAIVEFATDRPLDWHPASSASIVGRGSPREVLVKSADTTRGGRVAAGCVVRLGLETAREILRGAEGVEVQSGPALLWIELAD